MDNVYLGFYNLQQETDLKKGPATVIFTILNAHCCDSEDQLHFQHGWWMCEWIVFLNLKVNCLFLHPWALVASLHHSWLWRWILYKMKYRKKNTVEPKFGTQERGHTACALTAEVPRVKSVFCYIWHRTSLALRIYLSTYSLTHESYFLASSFTPAKNLLSVQ